MYDCLELAGHQLDGDAGHNKSDRHLKCYANDAGPHLVHDWTRVGAARCFMDSN